jgi:hypothetical protein
MHPAELKTGVPPATGATVLFGHDAAYLVGEVVVAVVVPVVVLR